MLDFLDQWSIDYLKAYCSFMGCLCMLAIFFNMKQKMNKVSKDLKELKADIERRNKRNNYEQTSNRS